MRAHYSPKYVSKSQLRLNIQNHQTQPRETEFPGPTTQQLPTATFQSHPVLAVSHSHKTSDPISITIQVAHASSLPKHRTSNVTCKEEALKDSIMPCIYSQLILNPPRHYDPD